MSEFPTDTLSPVSLRRYVVLYMLHEIGCLDMETIHRFYHGWQEHFLYLFRNCHQVFSDYDECRSEECVDIAPIIDATLRDHFLFIVSDETVRFIEHFLEINGVEFIGVPLLKNGDISLTHVGVSFYEEIQKIFRLQLIKPRLENPACTIQSDPIQSEIKALFLPRMETNYAFKRQNGINRSDLWKDRTEFIISRNEEGIKRLLESDREDCRQCGEIFRIGRWTRQWWNVHHAGVACMVQNLSDESEVGTSGAH